MKTNFGRLMSLLLCAVMLLTVLPCGVFAAEHENQVYVIVENTTYTDPYAPWSGTLVSEWVDIDENSTMMSCVVAALDNHGYTQTGAESNYISEINGLAAFDAGSMSGWMGTLNDWFTNEGFGAFTVANGTLEAGDEVKIMYTSNGYGEDIGGSWSNNDKTVKSVVFSEGKLTPSFDKDVHEYELTLPDGVSSVTVTPTASNKNYQVRTSVDGVEYKRTASVPVSDGKVITVKCGDPSWPSMNGGGEAQVYTFTVNQSSADMAAADEVQQLIDAIGAVTLSSEKAINAARKAYEALTDGQKALVEGYQTLVDAEKAYAGLIKAAGERPEEIYKSVGDYLMSLGVPNVGSTGGEWVVIGLARSDRDVPAGYYENVLQYVGEHINDKNQLHRAKSTDNSRVILALTALGYDVTDVGGHDLLAGLSDMTYIKKQGINGPIWALIAFDSHDYEIPEGDVSREELINYILGKQVEGGGWALSGKNADPDMTAMAIQALAPYYKTNAEVKTAVDAALSRLSALQNSVGGFASWGTTNSESCAQVLTALASLGVDPLTDERFIKNGCTVVDALSAFHTEGGFRHTADGKLNGMATEQGYYALAAYFRMKNGKTALYDMTDVDLGGKSDTSDDSSDVSGDTSSTDESSNVSSDASYTDESSNVSSDASSADDSGNVSGDVPSTGDGFDAAWMMLIAIAAAFAASVVIKKHKANV